MGAILKTENINSGYGKLQILFDVSVEFDKEGITAIVGPNGSGKSTLLKTIMGFTRIYSGRVYFDGKDITGKPPHSVTKMGVSYLPQVGNVFTSLTVYENLRLAGYTLDESELRDRMEQVTTFFPVLKDYMEKKVGRLSGGERQMVAMGMALIRNPKVMLFDEPSANLAPILAKKVVMEVRRLRDELGITIVIVEQIVRLALEIAEKSYLLVSGTVRYSGDAKDLLNNPDFGKMYLGIV